MLDSIGNAVTPSPLSYVPLSTAPKEERENVQLLHYFNNFSMGSSWFSSLTFQRSVPCNQLSLDNGCGYWARAVVKGRPVRDTNGSSSFRFSSISSAETRLGTDPNRSLATTRSKGQKLQEPSTGCYGQGGREKRFLWTRDSAPWLQEEMLLRVPILYPR